jgi:hypothetical protein
MEGVEPAEHVTVRMPFSGKAHEVYLWRTPLLAEPANPEAEADPDLEADADRDAGEEAGVEPEPGTPPVLRTE